MSRLRELAEEVAVSERSLHRGVACGLIRAERQSPRRLTISLREQRYLREHWPLLSRLRRTLRTERNVRLAVLFGSVARGTDRAGSDVDVLVSLNDERTRNLADLSLRLKRAIGREVQLVRLSHAEESPALLADALAEGRVLIDRDAEWARLKRGEARIRREARRADRELRRRAWAALDQLATS